MNPNQTEHTIMLIKPNAIKNKNAGDILKIVEFMGFEIVDMKMLVMDDGFARKFYWIHREKPFFERLIKFMTSGKIIAAILEKENAVADFRKLVGDTDPKLVESGTLRKLYADDVTYNAVHSSDSKENAVKEISLVFPEHQ